MNRFLRHFAACDNAVLPGRRLPFRVGAATVGWVLPEFARLLADFTAIAASPTGVTLTDAGDLQSIARALAERGVTRWRNEAFDVRAEPEGPVLALLDRGALPMFGVRAEGVHLDGLVHLPDGPHIWIARRAATKTLDPGKLDHITAGGIPAGLSPAETLVKEAAEEAAIPVALAAAARPVGTLAYAMERTEGLRRDLLHCYELDLPADFTPAAADGEVAGFELWPLPRAFAAVRDTDDFKFNVNLVLIRLFQRYGLFTPEQAAQLPPAM
ncbi:MAG: hypothetical protein BGP12_03765 [Rhodospirillales bacterium 70-18]|nr:DUF4743 domain-containing protein [Rhodospirillales bacterium]OJY64865.1 MAG: hypothetical protein BGP12_03765 [Rhodospirillales bacterium 70-18]